MIKIPNELLELEKQLCDCCLGRLFGKFGHGFENKTRGRAIRYALKNSIAEIEPDDITRYSRCDGKCRSTFLATYGIAKQFRSAKRVSIRGVPTEKSETFPRMLGKCFRHFPSHAEGNSEVYSEFIKEERIGCGLCGNIFNELEKFSELVIEKMSAYEFNTFLIGSKIDKETTDKEERLWKELALTHSEPIKTELNREVGKIVERKIRKPVEFKNPDITAVIDTRYDNVELQVAPLFIYGRYKKFIRDIPQTKWPCKRCWGKGCEKCNFTGKIYPTSVEEIIASKVMEASSGEEHFLHGLGREDIDARMLGTGRPFILEIRNPRKRAIDLKKLEPEINAFGKDKVEVCELRFTDFKEVVTIKQAEANKVYRAVVEFELYVENEKIKELENVFHNTTVMQRTPLRVVHRRSDMVRERKVIELRVELLENKEVALTIKTESGTYIKELISGDNGRTKPSISEILGVKCKVKELDVLGVEYG